MQLQMKELRRQEHCRYRDVAHGSLEKSRRYLLVSDLDSVLKKMNSMMDQQMRLLK